MLVLVPLHRTQYLNDPACPVRVLLQQGKSAEKSPKSGEAYAKIFEGNSPKFQEVSAKSDNTSAESTTDATAAPAAAENEKRVMVPLAVGVLGSKSVCRLRPQGCRRLAELAVEAFLGAREQGDDGQVRAFVMVLPQKACKWQTSRIWEHGTRMTDDMKRLLYVYDRQQRLVDFERRIPSLSMPRSREWENTTKLFLYKTAVVLAVPDTYPGNEQHHLGKADVYKGDIEFGSHYYYADFGAGNIVRKRSSKITA